MPKTKPPYAQGFRDQMVELVRSGRSPGDLSKEFGCHVTSILGWVRKAGRERWPGPFAGVDCVHGPVDTARKKRWRSSRCAVAQIQVRSACPQP